MSGSKVRKLAALSITVAPRVLMFQTLEMALGKAGKSSCGIERLVQANLSSFSNNVAIPLNNF